jgi:uncharacterized secreted protein with C-terminal beta-propeller domain
MVANTHLVVCPKCKAVNSYEIASTKLYDTDLHIAYICEACGTEYTDIYTLVYLGGHTHSQVYDRDNLSIG